MIMLPMTKFKLKNEVKKGKNGEVTHLTGDLYLLEATNKVSPPLH